MNDGRRYRSVRRVTRRTALSRIGVGALVVMAFDAYSATDASPKPACVATPEQTEGPYFVDERLNRADIRSDSGNGSLKERAPLKLGLFVHAVSDNACAPL